MEDKKENLKKLFNNLKVTLEIKVDDRAENEGGEEQAGVEFILTKDKNKDLFKLRDFFKASTEEVEIGRIKRPLYKKILVQKLKRDVGSLTDEFLKNNKIVLKSSSVADINLVRGYIQSFLDALRFSYEQYLNQGSYEIKINLV